MPLTEEQEAELLALLEAENRARSRTKIATIFPDAGPLRRGLYPKHVAFMAAGALHRERAMMAGNRCGKSLTAAYELTCHATGRYPDWWEGKRFSTPVTCWAAGESVRDVRDSAQQLLLGDLGAWGTGLIPGDAITRTTARPGTPDAVDTIHVRHASGGISTIAFRTYEAGREAFQAATVHVVWLDEEPGFAIYLEALMRTATTDGIVLATFTPLLGLSETALHFLPDGKPPDPAVTGPFVTFIEWSDIPHLSEQAKAELLASIPPHLRDARTKGIPQMGAGAIYPISEDAFLIDPMQIPAHWPRAYGLDVGWRTTAAVFGALDRDTDTLYLIDEYVRSEAEPAVHAAAIRARGAWQWGAVDPAARGRQQSDGTQLIKVYIDLGLQLRAANNAVETGLLEVWQRLTTGRLKVFRTMQGWLSEFRLYRRDEKGRVIKERDHCLDATRYLVMSGVDLAQCSPDYLLRSGWKRPQLIHDFDPFDMAQLERA
jgi:phage terminase large subunit-like protein